MTIMVGPIKNNGIWEGSFEVDCAKCLAIKNAGGRGEAQPPPRGVGGGRVPPIL